ncbi:hypothetical protein V6N13_110656 [Hibiscus sabdariffa]|uniref:Uncharacterized protein n=1 Tax=Hibiscus sabdariffa TaxID=183260 RepID=A0ABR2THW3_9ROSI
MAVQMDEAEFWLPTRFLMDDAIVMVKEKLKSKNNTELVFGYGFPTEFPFEFDTFDPFSTLNSHVQSVLGSTETESNDKNEFLAGLTRRLSLSQHKTGGVMSSSQSTLSGLGSWSDSRNGSPNGHSQVPSPTTIPFGAKNDT